MALSQVQCLDDNHVNPRTSEAKPEFLYCEDQRLALEALLRGGRGAFAEYLDARGLRGFLSDPELEALAAAAEPYDPGAQLIPAGAQGEEEEEEEGGGPPLSLRYWPELSDASVPRMDLGWPDADSYRGVTRAAVYTQPPLDGQAHVKEVVRKMIAQAQKVIAVVMDVFTDVDIFRDLLDAGFKRRVSVYILLERTTLPHFLSMCRRANMHAGHLKHLRVRCTEGTEFYTRSCTKVKGRMGHRFMFIDGDKAVSGSYSFTWMSSRLDRNLITVITGQAVDAFDRLFRFLYVTSSYVGLRHVATQPEPEPEPLPQPAAVVPLSAAIARKLYNPKYALLVAGSPISNPAPSPGDNSPTQPQNPENSKNPDVSETIKRRHKRATNEATLDVPPLHPGLADLEKVCLFAYLPTWPEPDPPSDVIGFINIRDAKKPSQVHLQRFEMFETSQAIRFSSPISMPKETMPEVAKPRQLPAAYKEVAKPQPVQNKVKAGESVVDGVQPRQRDAEPGVVRPTEETAEQKSLASGQKSEPAKDTTEVLTTDNNLHSDTPTSKDSRCNTAPCDAHTPPQFSSKASTPNRQGLSHSTATVTANSRKPGSLPGSLSKEAETGVNIQSVVVHRTETVEFSSTESQNLLSPSDSNSNTELQTRRTGLTLTNSHPLAVDTKPQNSSEMTANIPTPTVHSHTSTSVPITTTTTTITTNGCSPLSSVVSSSTSLTTFTPPNPPLPSSTASSTPTPTPPVPKPRTVQLIIRDGSTSDAHALPEISVVRRTESLASAEPLVVHSKPDVVNVVQTPKENPPEAHNGKTGEQKDTDNTGNPKEALQQQQQHSVASRETKGEEAVGLRDNRAETQTQSEVLITDAAKADSVNSQDIFAKDVDPKRLTSTDCEITSKTQPNRTDTEAPEEVLTGSGFSLTHFEMNPHNNGGTKTVNPLEASTHPPVSGTTNSQVSKDTDSQRGKPCVPSAPCTDSKPDVAKRNAHTNATPQELQQTPKPRGNLHTPERPLRLHLSDTHVQDLRSSTPERELRPVTAVMRTPTPDGFPSRTPTPDSRTHTPDPRSYTPDFRISTPEVSDGCVSPRDDSTLSTTSEEYYECSDSPFHDPVFDGVGNRILGITENQGSFTPTNTPNATAVTTTSPPYINNSTAMLSAVDMNNSSSETQCLSVRLSSSLLEKTVNLRGEGEMVNEENGREEDEKVREKTAADRTEQDSQGAEKRGIEEAKKTADPLLQGSDLTEMVEKDTESQLQVPKRNVAPNKSAIVNVVDGVTLGKSNNEASDLKRLTTEGLKPDDVSSEAGRPDKAALRPSGADKRDEPQLTRESDGQELLPAPKLSQAQQQQDSRSSSPSRPLSTTQPVGIRPWGTHQLNQSKCKALQSGVQNLDSTSAPGRPPSRSPAPLPLAAVGSAAGRKQVKLCHNQQNLSQLPAAQGRTKVGQSQNQHPYLKPHPSSLFTHSNIHSQRRPHSHSQTVAEPDVRRQEERTSPFTITFGRLYNLQGLKDKMSNFPAQSKRGSTS